jgi:hypothetical protein
MAVAPHVHVQRASRGLFAVARGETAAHEHLRDRVLSIIWVTVVIDEILFALYAITVVAALAGSFGAFFHKRGQEIAAEKAAAEAAASSLPPP